MLQLPGTAKCVFGVVEGVVGDTLDPNAVSCLDVLKGTWGVSTRSLSGESLPDELACMALAWDKEKAYMFAGLVTSKKLINDIYEVNLSSLVCRKLKPALRSAPPPSERNHSAMIYWKAYQLRGVHWFIIDERSLRV